MDKGEFSTHSLQNYSYRSLQQIAKAMNLPCNVKKVLLIKMIHAKRCLSRSVLENIVKDVKMQRKNMQDIRKAARKRALQANEVTSTCNSNKSPFMLTPEHNQILLSCSPSSSRSVKYYMRNKQTEKLYSPSKGSATSDRVLRSSNLNKFKTVREARSILHPVNTVGEHSTAQNRKTVSTQVDLSDDNQKARSNTKVYGSERVLWTERVNRSIPKVYVRRSDKLVLDSRDLVITPPPAQRERTLSGIYPLEPREQRYNLQYVKSLTFLRSDGKYSKINALVQEPLMKSDQNKQEQVVRRNVVTIQDIIDNSVETQTISQPSTQGAIEVNRSDSQYFMPINLDLVRENPQIGYDQVTCDFKENDPELQYNHKKIRAEKLRYQRSSVQREGIYDLPHINNAFTRFNSVQYETQPIYVKDSVKSARSPKYGNTEENTERQIILETFYSIKNECFNRAVMPLVQTTINTVTVNSTPIFTTSCMQHTSHAYNDQALYEQDSQQFGIRTNISTSPVDQQHVPYYNDRVMNSSITQLDDSLGANVTIPEMVEDAMEIISQDGDYMERIGMDIRVQCVLCDWAGPKLILEYHIRKEHTCEIERQCGGLFGAQWGGQARWRRVLDLADSLYLLNVTRTDHTLRADISIISYEVDKKYASITVYNKLTGEPYMWQGEIQPMPLDLVFTEADGLEINLLSANQYVDSNRNFNNSGIVNMDNVNVTFFVTIW